MKIDLFDIDPKYRRTLFYRVAFGCSGNICYLQSIKLTDISKSGTIFFTNPMFIALFAYLFIHERLTKYDLFAILLSITGIVITINPF